MALNFVKTLKVASGKFECPFLVSGSITLCAFFALQLTLSHKPEHEIHMSEGEQSDKADLGISSLGKTRFHPQYTLYTYILLMGEKNKIPPPTHECPCCGICQESTWSLCTSQGLCPPELKHNDDYAWHFE